MLTSGRKDPSGLKHALAKARAEIERLTKERDAALALLADAYGAGTGGSVIESLLADAERDMRQRAANTAKEYCDNGYGHIVNNAILALPLKYMGQIHAECDCPHPDRCTSHCIAERNK